jgi:fructokinase
MNSTRLGLNTVLVATVGNDGFMYINKRLSNNGINTSYVKVLDNKSTSVIFVSRSDGTPILYPIDSRLCIYEDQISSEN